MTKIVKKVLCGWLLFLSFSAVAVPSTTSVEETEQTTEEGHLLLRDGQTYGTGGG